MSFKAVLTGFTSDLCIWAESEEAGLSIEQRRPERDSHCRARSPVLLVCLNHLGACVKAFMTLLERLNNNNMAKSSMQL